MKKPNRKLGWVYDLEPSNDLDPGKGLLLGVVLGIMCWVVIILGIVWIWS